MVEGNFGTVVSTFVDYVRFKLSIVNVIINYKFIYNGPI